MSSIDKPPPLLLLDDDADDDLNASDFDRSEFSYTSLSENRALYLRSKSFSADPKTATFDRTDWKTGDQRGRTRRVDPVPMAPPRRVLKRTEDSSIGEREEERTKQPNPWRVDMDSEANRVSFDFIKLREELSKDVDRCHRQATERFHRTHQKHDREVARLRAQINKMEKALKRKTEIETNAIEAVARLGEFKRNARYAAKMFRIWRESTRVANEPGKKVRQSAQMRRAFCDFRKNVKISKALKERRASEAPYAFTKARGGNSSFFVDSENEEILLRKQLEEANRKLAETDARSTQMEHTMRQAFMRGVCALNLEAMKLMRNEDGTTVAAGNSTFATAENDSARPASPETVVRRALEKAQIKHRTHDFV
jgi:uncharacterized protein YukE